MSEASTTFPPLLLLLLMMMLNSAITLPGRHAYTYVHLDISFHRLEIPYLLCYTK